MARPIRIEYENAYYHVMNRGLERRQIFLNNNHRNLFLDLLSEINQRYKIEIHSYCLMDNHYHLLVRTPLPNLGLAIKHLNGVYTKRFNKDIKRDGPLFRGRYKSILVEKDKYLTNLSRYIHKNPSTAKLVNDDESYHWSSYKYYARKMLKPKWLFLDEILGTFSYNRAEYVKFVECDIDENIKKFYSKEYLSSILGSVGFIKKVSDKFLNNGICKQISYAHKNQINSVKYPSIEDTISYIAKERSCSEESLIDNKSRNYSFERSLAIYLAMLNPNYSIIEKGEFFGISGTGFSLNCKRFMKYLEANKNIFLEVENLRKRIYG